MSTKQKEQLSLQTNAADQDKESYSITEQQKIPGTPFTAIRVNDKWFLAMANYKLTEETETLEECLEKLETEKWLIVMHLAIITQEKTKQLKLQDGAYSAIHNLQPVDKIEHIMEKQ